MTDEELATLASIKGFAAANRVSMTGHALTEMVLAGAQRADVLCALRNAKACRDQRADAKRAAEWKVTGPDRDGDDLDCAVIIENGVLVVTVF